MPRRLDRVALKKPDVVLMDINLPGMNGIQCTRTTKEHWPEVQVMMYYSVRGRRQRCLMLKAGATGYVMKRAPIEELFDAIQRSYAGGSPMSATIARKVVGSFRYVPRNGEAQRT